MSRRRRRDQLQAVKRPEKEDGFGGVAVEEREEVALVLADSKPTQACINLNPMVQINGDLINGLSAPQQFPIFKTISL